MTAYATPVNPDGSTTTRDTTTTPGGAPGASVTRDRYGNVTDVDLDGADAWAQRQNEQVASSGFDYARTGDPNDLRSPAAPNPPAGPSPAQQQAAQDEADDQAQYEEHTQYGGNDDANDNYAE